MCQPTLISAPVTPIIGFTRAASFEVWITMVVYIISKRCTNIHLLCYYVFAHTINSTGYREAFIVFAIRRPKLSLLLQILDNIH